MEQWKTLPLPSWKIIQLTDHLSSCPNTKQQEDIMSKAIANGTNEAERQAAHYAAEVQDGCNLIAIVGCFHRHLVAMRNAGVCGDNLNNPPVSLAFVSKLNALCRLTDSREIAALIAIERIENGEAVEYEVVPI
jgi:hypothetical protein